MRLNNKESVALKFGALVLGQAVLQAFKIHDDLSFLLWKRLRINPQAYIGLEGLEEWKIPFHATLNPPERKMEAEIVEFHWDLYRARYPLA